MFGNDHHKDDQQQNAPTNDFGQSSPQNGPSGDSTFGGDNNNGSSFFSSAPPASDSTPPQHDNSGSGPSGGSEDLLHIKQQALQHLSPLVGHLDQSPEEKFRTTMMMIQASDDQSLIKEAYDAAEKISDDKARAQALLDVINEINYFTQQHNSQS